MLLKSLRSHSSRAGRRPRPHHIAAAERLEGRTLLAGQPITLNVAADGDVTDAGKDGTWDTVDTTSPTVMVVYSIPSAGQTGREDRGVFEFDVSSAAGVDFLASASLSVRVSKVTYSAGDVLRISVYAYAGDGAVTAADATRTARKVGELVVDTSATETILGPKTVTLDAAALRPLVAAGGYVGFVTVLAGPDGREVSVWSSEAPEAANRPKLNLVPGARPQDDLVGYDAGAWQVASSTGSSFQSRAWSVWRNLPWDALTHGDFDGDGRTDVLGLLGGLWQVGLARGTGASAHFATSLWGNWGGGGWRDVTVGDLNGDGKDDVLARGGAGTWYAALSTGTAFAGPALRGVWHEAPWKAVALADLDGDGQDDLLANSAGQWHAALSNGTTFGVRSLWSAWSDLAWEKLGTFDADGDGRADVVGFYRGTWQVGRSTGTGFTTGLLSRWAALPWKDALTGDFDGDGKGDVAARSGGLWQVTLATGTTKVWSTWSDLDWRDVRVGDFDGDGRDDIAARYRTVWQVGRSTGSGFATGLWGGWHETAWRAVAAVDVTGQQGSAASQAGPTGSPSAFRASAPATAPTARAVTEDEPLAAFWQVSGEDEEFVGRLAAG